MSYPVVGNVVEDKGQCFYIYKPCLNVNLYTSLPSPLRTLARQPWYVMIYPETVQQTNIFSTKLISEMPLQEFAWLYNKPSLDVQDT